MKVAWNHGICDDCWQARHPGTPNRVAVRVKGTRNREQCCDCGMPTTSGIYIRDDPTTVRYPRPVRDDA